MIDEIDRRVFLAIAASATSASALAQIPANPARGGSFAGRQARRVIEVPERNAVFGDAKNGYKTFQYSPAVWAGDLLFISGVIGVKADGTTPASPSEQAEVAFGQLKEILNLAGLSVDDIVELESFHVDVSADLADFGSVKAKHIHQPFPNWTVTGVKALDRPELKVKIRAIAASR